MTLRTTLALIAATGATASIAAAQNSIEERRQKMMMLLTSEPIIAYSCHPVDEHGHLGGGPFIARGAYDAAVDGIGRGGAVSVTLQDNGPPENRIDIVFVGDGYTAGEMGTFATHVDNARSDLFAKFPFSAYQSLFNVHRVEAISAESGVDNDPTQGIFRNTAIDMGFWCGGTERALCMSVFKAYQFAANAPDADQVLGVANSTKYGGVGYPSNNAGTLSGGNSSATEIAIHELGHSLGNLADEYDYGGPTVYTGSEPFTRNVSIYDTTQMANLNTKWANWLGDAGNGGDGPVATYEGAHYSEQGIFRPTPNSEMRALFRPFNAPSIEGLIIEFYRIVDPIDSSTPTGAPLGVGDTISVDTVGVPLDISWIVDGEELVGESGMTLPIGPLGLSFGMHTIDVVVRDETSYVRDEDARDLWMTSQRSWSVNVTGGLGDLNFDGVVGSGDLSILIGSWGSTTSVADLDGDGTVGSNDLALLIGNWT